MKVWITADVLKTGIVTEREAKGCGDGLVLSDYRYFCPGDWYPTPEAAVARARTMRDLEVAKLRRQIERLAAMVFEVGT